MTTVFLVWAIVATVAAVVNGAFCWWIFRLLVRANDTSEGLLRYRNAWKARAERAEQTLAEHVPIRPAIARQASTVGDADG